MMLNTIELRTIGVEGTSHLETQIRPEVLPLSKKHTSWFQGGINREACPLTTLLTAAARYPNMESWFMKWFAWGLSPTLYVARQAVMTQLKIPALKTSKAKGKNTRKNRRKA